MTAMADKRIKSITIFKCAYVCLLILSFLNFSSQNVSLLASILAIVGGALIFWGLVRKRLFTMPGIVFLTIFLGIYLVSCMINLKYGIIGNIKSFIWLLLQFFLLYTVDDTVEDSYYKREAVLLMRLYSILIFITSLIALIMAVLHIEQVSEGLGGTIIRGVYAGRLYGEYTDPNYGAMFAVIAIFFSSYLWQHSSYLPSRFFFSVNVLVQCTYCFLSGSRTAILSLLICMVMGLALWVYKRFVRGNALRQRYWRIFISVILAAFIIGILFFLYRAGLAHVEDTLAVDVEEAADHYIGRDLSTADFTSGRFKIWFSGMEVWKTTPFFGTSPRNLLPYAKAVLPDTYIATQNYVAMHNVFLDLLVETGVLGLLSMLGFIGYMAVWIFKRWGKTAYEDFPFSLCIAVTVTAIGISACFLTEILFINSVGAFFFWSCLGYLVHFSTEKQRQ